jgi:hypothetical protein
VAAPVQAPATVPNIDGASGVGMPQPAGCTGGRVVTSQSAGNCCWPGQGWDAARSTCTGPPMCPPGFFAEGDNCVSQ